MRTPGSAIDVMDCLFPLIVVLVMACFTVFAHVVLHWNILLSLFVGFPVGFGGTLGGLLLINTMLRAVKGAKKE